VRKHHANVRDMFIERAWFDSERGAFLSLSDVRRRRECCECQHRLTVTDMPILSFSLNV
jgi:hypothetical protein